MPLKPEGKFEEEEDLVGFKQVVEDGDYDGYEMRCGDWLDINSPGLKSLGLIEDVKNIFDLPQYGMDHLISRTWYRNIIPSIYSTRFPYFLMQQVGMINSIYRGNKQTEVMFTTDTSSAMVNIKTRDIFLGEDLLLANLYHAAGMSSDMAAAITSVVNGNISHEALHLAHSPYGTRQGIILVRSDMSNSWFYSTKAKAHIEKTLKVELSEKVRRKDKDKVAAYIKRTSDFPDSDNYPTSSDYEKVKAEYWTGKAFWQVLETVSNILEDIYIERIAKQTLGSRALFIGANHQFFFSWVELVRRLSLCTQHSEKNQTEMLDFLNIIACLKNWTFLESPQHFGPLIQDYIKMFRMAEDLSEAKDRIRLSLYIALRIFEDKRVFINLDKVQEEMGNESLTSSTEISELVKGSSLAGAIKGWIRGQEKAGKTSEEAQAMSDAVDKLGDLLSKANQDERLRLESKHTTLKEAELGTFTHLATNEDVIPRDIRFKQFGQKLRRILGRGKGPTELKRSGQTLSEDDLDRIATDGKVFTDLGPRIAKAKDYEIAILMDLSGSMLSSSKKLEKTISAGISSWESLRRVGCVSWLAGHTTFNNQEDSGREYPVLYMFALPTTPFALPGQRANRWYLRKEDNRNNLDGQAIKKFADITFSKRAGKKVLIVISDGQPHGNGYGGPLAIRHVERVVKEIRRDGINVISISIDKDADAANDEIYGKDKNIKNNNPAILLTLLQTIFKIN